MATTTQKLTFEEFEAEYGQADRTYEFWFGEAIPKGMPTWIHGLLQKIVMQLLEETGFTAASVQYGATNSSQKRGLRCEELNRAAQSRIRKELVACLRYGL